jgi:hypothetical protein
MSIPTFVAAMLDMLFQRVEVPDGNGWMSRSLSGQPGNAAYPVQS